MMGPFSFKQLQFDLRRLKKALAPICALSVLVLATSIPFFANANDGGSCAQVFATSSVFSPHQTSLIATYKGGAKNYYETLAFAKKISLLPLAEKTQWMKDIGAVYRAVPKKDPSPLASWHIGGRRLLDYAMTWISRHDLAFSEASQNKVPTKTAYEQFLAQQRSFYNINYSSKEVFLIVESLQKNLQALPQERAPAKLLLAGSFINGKASLQKSDIDLTTSDARLMSLMPAWEKTMNEVLRQALKDDRIQMTLEGHIEPLQFYGKINPVLIEVTATQVRLIVFEPARIQADGRELTAGNFKIYDM